MLAVAQVVSLEPRIMRLFSARVIWPIRFHSSASVRVPLPQLLVDAAAGVGVGAITMTAMRLRARAASSRMRRRGFLFRDMSFSASFATVTELRMGYARVNSVGFRLKWRGRHPVDSRSATFHSAP